MEFSLLTTKLYMPAPRSDLVPRYALIGRLKAAHECKLILISAPAGFGKSTLLSQWISETNTPTSWITLDERDNDPARFMAYLGAAVQKLGIAIPQTSPQGFGSLHPSQQSSVLESAMISIINGISRNESAPADSERLTARLVLDDFHLVSASVILQAIAFLLDHMPHSMQLVIATRADPPLPLALLRGRGQLLELRLQDLRFNPEEAKRLLSSLVHHDVPSEVVSLLSDATEGWIAGLQMAALSMQSAKDAQALSRFAHSFEGTNRYILDYLVEEVLQHQPGHIQRFLLKTSILDRLTAPLCDALMQGENRLQADELGSQQILERLERENLFVMSLDQNRAWYRYHQLFSDLLRKRLEQEQPGMVFDLHRTASHWFQGQGLMAEAIDHAFAAEDFHLAADLANAQAETIFKRSEINTLLGWIEMLPEELIRSRHDLCLFQAWTLLMSGRPINQIQDCVNNAAVELDPARIAPLRAFIAMYQGRFQEASEIAERALIQLPPDSDFLRSMAVWTRSLTAITGDDLASSSQILREVFDFGQDSGNLMMSVATLSHLGGVMRRQGRLREAEKVYEQALQLAGGDRGSLIPIAGEAMLGLGELWREWNDLEKATSYLEEGIRLNEQLGPITALEGYLYLALVRKIEGRFRDAHELLAIAQDAAVQFDATEWDDILVAAYQARVWIAEGNLDAAQAWAKQRGLDVKHATGSFEQIDDSLQLQLIRHEKTILGRLFLALGQLEEALSVTDGLLKQVKEQGRVSAVLELSNLQAVIRFRQGDQAGALRAVSESLALAEPGGFIRVFLDEGEPMAQLLYQAVQAGIHPRFAGQLLACFPEQTVTADHLASADSPPPLVEPLTTREEEVLALIAEGLSNREVAEQLYLSTSTVKAHTYNIYTKLSVHSRTQAVHKARTLGILPHSQ